MKLKYILLYIIGLGLLVFGNRNFWDELQESRKKEKLEDEKKHVNDGIAKRFETQRLEYDAATGKWKNPNYYFKVINLGNFNFKTLNKGKTTVETNDDENASDSQ
ncbi:hypothetical protein [Neptunitalea lumnitzerae]|uniref:Uncharacterized protein n=1 Tax=Neptunitalea lumnitzerae TaxID=2965509 RepID=A0ABQ5MN71_9FLAO|nr:hypothetical protein [Neptunitalea sp. Y10]GLB50427.1 hypothetical protein Y10_27950 [Neptunitalea sp. Y10]